MIKKLLAWWFNITSHSITCLLHHIALQSALHIVLLGSLLLFLDVRQTSGSGTAICRKTLAAGVNRDFIQNEDDDVAAERKRVDLLEQEAVS